MIALASINPSKKTEIDYIAQLYIRYGRIYISLNYIDEDRISLSVIQTKNLTGNYLSEELLILRMKKTFGNYTDKVIEVSAMAYEGEKK